MIAGQYLAFTAILAVAIVVTFGARFLPEEALPYLGLLPIALGLRDAWKAWQTRKLGDHGEQAESGPGGPAIVKVATTTFANGGDNIGVYVPVFTNVGTSGTIVYCVVFLVLVGVSVRRRPVPRHPPRHRQAPRQVGPHPAARGPDHHRPAHPHRGRRLRLVGTPGGMPGWRPPRRRRMSAGAARLRMSSRPVADTLVSSLSLDIRCTPDYTLMQ